MDDEVINIVDYKDSDRFKELKQAIWKQAANNQPFEIKEFSANEYRYFHKFYEISRMLIAKSITKEQASEMDKQNYMRFEFDQRVWENYQFRTSEFNQNIKRSEELRIDFARVIGINDGYLILAEMVSKLTGDRTVLAHAQDMARRGESESAKQANRKGKN